ncbi:nitrate reductase [Arthroderma uncinatum]|uniref:nitrate reductase n=1 Tax=Arthroderma uncinatum TaxID=74035 RepID=UPI00144A81C7|nr:nitrate reductase [Arthroderma uncinatum]KAF3491130.1 nitrate reductase [Arthroderma uncinatum]
MSLKKHLGASDLDILNEPDWTRTHSHRVGTRGRDARFMGMTHGGDEYYEELEEVDEKIQELRDKVNRGELVTDFHLERPEVHPDYWRYVLHTTESFIKLEQPWPVNQKKAKEREKEEADKAEQEKQQKEKDSSQGEGEQEKKSKPKPTLEEETLLQFLQHEQQYRSSMGRNDGKGNCPIQDEILPSRVDEVDQFTPDNWIPRNDKLIRLTGKHPMNAESDLTTLFEAGLITPSPVHYVRNHGTVPHLLWENHEVEVVADQRLVYTMDNLKDSFESINIPVFLACDGSRRKELNMIKKTRAFNFTAASASCSYWKGVLLRDVLLEAGVDNLVKKNPDKRLWVNYEGADELSEGKYATCVPLEYAMDPINDVMLAYEMNDHPLPPDHGYPLRLILPGWVGARSIKWLAKIWVTEHENDSHYHIYDNRQLPSFITDTESEIAQTMYRHPSTICNEQMLNSIIVRPAQGEKIDLVDVKKGKMYRIMGFAYSGSGDEIDRVEISLNGGETWLYCSRRYPDKPIRHGKKFWTWLHWHIDLDITRLIRAQSVLVRAFDSHKNTQPRKPVWNIGGMMNNCWYEVRPEVFDNQEDEEAYLLFRHPVDAASGTNGWMKPSTEERIEEIKRNAFSPEKQFTRQEIEKHHTEDDCWIVVNGNVYDATHVLSWHPGGKGAIMAHAGIVHWDTTEEFSSIHDNYAQDKLKECIIGKVTQKAMDHMMKEAEQKKKERLQSEGKDSKAALAKHKWTQAKLLVKKRLSKDTSRYTFKLPASAKELGLETGQHVLTYLPNEDQPGGTMSNILDCLRDNEEIEVKGPSGDIQYRGNGCFTVDNKEYKFDNVSLILGGSGVTPGYQVIARVLQDNNDKTKIKVIDANKTEGDILLRGDLDEFSLKHKDRFEIVHVLSNPSDDWQGPKGHVNEEIIRKHAFEPGKKNVALLCGPPAMIQKAVLPALTNWGYEEDENLFGF